jgi:transitional endoplasmic reticulum ATPase
VARKGRKSETEIWEEIFRNAKVSSPCILVFDELDSLARPRDGGVEDITGNE